MSTAPHSPPSPPSGRAGPRQDGLSRFRAAFTVLRDVTMTGLALYGVWHQESSGRVNPWLLLTYVVILGLVPASHALALLRSLPSQLPSSAATPEPATQQPPPS